MNPDDDTPCGWCGHRWDIHNHVTDQCYEGDDLILDELVPGPDSCTCPGWANPS